MVFVGSGSSPTFDTDPDRQHWMCRCLIIFDLCPVREFEETERLTAQLTLAEQEIAELKNNLKNMEVVLGEFIIMCF